MALLIIGGLGYALLVMFMLGAMMLSGRASDRETRRLQPVQANTSKPVARSNPQPSNGFSAIPGRNAA
ncbi:hypothetical protein [Kushneria indalinina]|uniref:Uncharacterized protein n=1 Tax=Kushneria indalinina DSM 14324 TaxID=1122140 RepID=A0A3D9DWU5_9GAMM|nr:hypothetical protein [Kushneria indalinina]REC95260.1 hypothetical protein C8D72_2096 [Kushneria indalinina DSM 14324]